MVQNKILEDLAAFFSNETRINVAYLFGSYAKKTPTSESDIDIAVLLSETPKKLLEYHLYLVNQISKISKKDVDLIVLNVSPPLLKHQVIKHGKVIYSKDEEERIVFEAKAESEYMDFSIAIERYDKCLMKQILA